MNNADPIRMPLAIVCGTLCLIVGLVQFLYSFLAFASVILVDLLGIGLTLASSAIAAVPEEPYEIPYARTLAKTIAVTGVVFAIVVFVSGCRCFYKRHISRIDSFVCAVISTFLSALHFANSLSSGGFVYVATTFMFVCILLGDWGIVAFSNSNVAEQIKD